MGPSTTRKALLILAFHEVWRYAVVFLRKIFGLNSQTFNQHQFGAAVAQDSL